MARACKRRNTDAICTLQVEEPILHTTDMGMVVPTADGNGIKIIIYGDTFYMDPDVQNVNETLKYKKCMKIDVEDGDEDEGENEDENEDENALDAFCEGNRKVCDPTYNFDGYAFELFVGDGTSCSYGECPEEAFDNYYCCNPDHADCRVRDNYSICNKEKCESTTYVCYLLYRCSKMCKYLMKNEQAEFCNWYASDYGFDFESDDYSDGDSDDESDSELDGEPNHGYFQTSWTQAANGQEAAFISNSLFYNAHIDMEHRDCGQTPREHSDIGFNICLDDQIEMDKFGNKRQVIHRNSDEDETLMAVYANGWFYVCPDDQETCNADDKKLYLLTNTFGWESPAENLRRSIGGTGFYNYEDNCRLEFSSDWSAERTESCQHTSSEQVDILRPQECLPSRPESDCFSFSGKNTFWHGDSKFFHAIAIPSDLLGLDAYSASPADEEYVYFLGTGETCNQEQDSWCSESDTAGSMYLARIRANENSLAKAPKHMQYYQGMNALGYSIWRPDHYTDSRLETLIQTKAYENAKKLLDLSTTPTSVIKRNGEFLLTTGNTTATAVFSSPDGINWRHPMITDDICSNVTGISNCKYFTSDCWDAQIYGSFFVPPSLYEENDTRNLYYVLSTWLSMEGTKEFGFKNYNTKLARFEAPATSDFLVSHDYYSTWRWNYPSFSYRWFSLTYNRKVIALPFKGFSAGGENRRKVVIQYCDCGDLPTEQCKDEVCQPWKPFFEESSSENNWKFIEYETRESAGFTFEGYRAAPPIPDCSDAGFGQCCVTRESSYRHKRYLENVPFSTNAQGDGRATVPVWRWHNQLKRDGVIEQDNEIANVILRFSTYVSEVSNERERELLANIHLAIPDHENSKESAWKDKVSWHWRTTEVVSLRYDPDVPIEGMGLQLAPRPLPMSPLSVDNLFLAGYRDLDGKYSARMAMYDRFTLQAIDLGEMNYVEGTPENEKAIPDGVAAAGGMTIDGVYKQYIWGGSNTDISGGSNADINALRLHEGLYNPDTENLEWTVLQLDVLEQGKEPVLLDGATMLFDELTDTLILLGVPDVSNTSRRHIYVLEEETSPTHVRKGWRDRGLFATELQYASLAKKDFRSLFIIGGKTSNLSAAGYSDKIYLLNMNDLAKYLDDPDATEWTDYAQLVTHIPEEGRIGVATVYEPRTQKLFLFGGATHTGGLQNDILVYNVGTGTWDMNIDQGSEERPGKTAGGLLILNNYLKQIALVGGVREDSQDTNDYVMQFDPTWETAVWSEKPLEGQCGDPSFGECPEGYYCEDYTCHSGCDGHEDCESGQYCEKHLCLNKCREDEDCPAGFICKPFADSGIDGNRCAQLTDPDCNGCTCDYFDEYGNRIDGCQDQNNCSTTDGGKNSVLYRELLLVLSLFGLPFLYLMWLRRRSTF